MTRDRQRQLIGGNSQAVVEDFDEIESPALDVDQDARSLRIDRILDELLYDRCRTLDNLARRDLTDRQRIELTYRSHARSFALTAPHSWVDKGRVASILVKDSSLGEASARRDAAARKGRETPTGNQIPPNQGGI